MRRPAQRRRGSLSFNMTPMIDIVFQLIIFFLVASHLARQEVQLELDLPSARTHAGADDLDSPRVIVNVLPDGEVRIGAEPITDQQLRRSLAERRRRNKDVEVRIRADRNVPYEHVEPVMLACAESGIWNFAFAVINPADTPR